ncbi:transforming growth factor beta receptor type 3 [Tachysurus ichikawai]
MVLYKALIELSSMEAVAETPQAGRKEQENKHRHGITLGFQSCLYGSVVSYSGFFSTYRKSCSAHVWDRWSYMVCVHDLIRTAHSHTCRGAQVSDGSVVQFEDGNPSLFGEVHTEALPHGNEHLMSWAKRLYHAVTSFTELKMTHDIYIKVGEDFPSTRHAPLNPNQSSTLANLFSMATIDGVCNNWSRE